MVQPRLHIENIKLSPSHIVKPDHTNSELSGDVPHGHGEDLSVFLGQSREVAMGTSLARSIVYEVPLQVGEGQERRAVDKKMTVGTAFYRCKRSRFTFTGPSIDNL